MEYDRIDAATLAGRLRVPRCVVRPSVPSTMDVLHELAAAGAEHATVVLADEQTRGRGRQGREWVSPAGQGIWLSYLHRAPESSGAALASIRAGLAVRAVLETAGVPAESKWPNDILADGKKVAGILCESRWRGNSVDWVVVGIGVNVLGPAPAGVEDVATTVDQYQSSPQRVDLVESIVRGLRHMPDGPVLTSAEMDQFARRDWLAERPIREPVAGTVQGIDPHGALIVKTPHGTEAVAGGHVVTA